MLFGNVGVLRVWFGIFKYGILRFFVVFVTAPFIRLFSNRVFSLEKELKSYGKRSQTPLLWDFSVCLYYTIRALFRFGAYQRGR